MHITILVPITDEKHQEWGHPSVQVRTIDVESHSVLSRYPELWQKITAAVTKVINEHQFTVKS
jgi:hypothetical protein